MSKFLTILLILGMSLSMTSCSNKKVKSEIAEEQMVEEDLDLDDSEFIVDAESDDPANEEEQVASIESVEPVDEMEEVELEGQRPSIITGDEVYEIQKGETLMWVAFKVYGDYRRWKEIRDTNQDVLSDGVQPGDKIKYSGSQFVWNPKGLPHLIRIGDTLGSISNEKYGNTDKWKSIWDNNKDQIRDPNLIFAGFTLYYIPAEREIASENL